MYIAVIDYDMGNIKSVQNSFKKAGAAIKVTSDAGVIKGASAVVLPGVGAYRDAMINLEERGLAAVIREVVNSKPFLGICLGMQLMFDYSLEDGKNSGLRLLRGSVRKIPSGVKIPHMGWNQINKKTAGSRLLEGIREGEYFYFVHSFYAVPDHSGIISSTAEYGTELTASIEKDNMYGCQFHPEKSSTAGQVIIGNFIRLAEEAG